MLSVARQCEVAQTICCKARLNFLLIGNQYRVSESDLGGGCRQLIGCLLCNVGWSLTILLRNISKILFERKYNTKADQ